MQDLLRNLPKVDDILANAEIGVYRKLLFHERIRNIIQEEIEHVRQCIMNNEILSPKREDLTDKIILSVLLRLKNENKESLQRVINATGIIIHTNLGRAPLSFKAASHVADIASHYNNLEYSIVTGERRNRLLHIEKMLADLTGAEAALLVNNNAAAVFLALHSLALDKEVVLSRGEMVEIGESFRISEIIEKSGCQTKEIGTTNKTKILDYEKAISEDTSVLLKVHTSNFKVIGFTAEVTSDELVSLKNSPSHKDKNLMVMEDMGSGILLDLSRFGLPKERTVQEAIKDGVDIVTFSGDKMLGGPQAGFIIGKKKYIDILKKNQLLRCFRLDKMSLAAIESVIQDYFTNDFKKFPIYQKMLAPLEVLEKRAEKLLSLLPKNDKVSYRIDTHVAQFGGGSLPDETIDSVAIYVKTNKAPQILQEALRQNSTPIIAISVNNELVLDMRTLFDDELPIIQEAFYDLANKM